MPALEKIQSPVLERRGVENKLEKKNMFSKSTVQAYL